ncbi:uncharacterized protein VTP21DRAFT_8902 [Calcarisporiella thermophila]|uniref:uncharacterized protein n=1 Tax=Calcarisporiella thermophila TaxID=911321 RepID=UPI0037436EB4
MVLKLFANRIESDKLGLEDPCETIVVEVEHSIDSKGLAGPPPDGGWGWVVVFATFLILFVCFGLNNTWGVYQEFYMRNNPEFGLFHISLIGGLNNGLTFLGGPLAGPLITRFGYRVPMLIGTFLLPISLCLASFTTQVWHLYLSQGILFPVAASMLFLPAMPLPSQWFLKRRALATSICSSGSGIGGLLLAPIIRYLISQYSVEWCLRIVAGISFVFCLLATMLARPRIAASARKCGNKAFDLSLFRQNSGFCSLVAYAFINNFGYLIPFIYIPSYATHIGLQAETGAMLLGLLSGINAVGRIFSGYLADIIGSINVQLAFVLLSGLSCILVWLFANSFVLLLIFVILFGLLGGAYWAVMPSTAADIVGVEYLGSALNLIYLSNVVPLAFGTMVASSLLEKSGSYTPPILFAGLTLIAGSALLVHTRLWKSKRIFARV